MTRLLLAGEPATAGQPDRRRLQAWHESLARAGMVEAGDSFDDSGRLVVVVREQLDLLNAQYCRAVLGLETAAGFDSFVTEALATGRYDLATVGSLLSTSAAQPEPGAVAVPWSRLPAPVRDAGPVLLGAIRLLHKRLARLGVVGTGPAGATADAARDAAAALRERAVDSGWDDATFWGWSPDAAAATAERFRAGNDAFAKLAWGTDWPDPPRERAHTRFDLAGRPPALVGEVLAAVQDAVDAC